MKKRMLIEDYENQLCETESQIILLRAQLASAHVIIGELRDATQAARRYIDLSCEEGFAAYNDAANAIALADEILNPKHLSAAERQAMRGGLPEVTGGNLIAQGTAATAHS